MTHFVNVTLLRLQAADQTIQGVLYFVEDKTRDVTLRHELINANAAKDQFLALLSHELRNPLSPVIAMVGELEATTPRSPKLRQLVGGLQVFSPLFSIQNSPLVAHSTRMARDRPSNVARPFAQARC